MDTEDPIAVLCVLHLDKTKVSELLSREAAGPRLLVVNLPSDDETQGTYNMAHHIPFQKKTQLPSEECQSMFKYSPCGESSSSRGWISSQSKQEGCLHGISGGPL